MNNPLAGRALGLTLGIVVLQALMLVAFAWPTANLAPRDVPLVVAGPPQAAVGIAAGLERDGAFAVTRLPDEAAARAALTDREAYGAVVAGPAGPRVLVASAASPAVAQQLGLLAQRLSGTPAAPVEDVVAADPDDPRGAVLGVLVLPLIMSGMAAAVLLFLLLPAAGARFAALLGIAVLGGLVTTLIAQTWLSALPGSFLAVWGVLGLAILSVAGAVAGLSAVLGRPGIGLGALTMLLLGNPLSAAASAPELLPAGWGALGQLLPPGAAVSLLRSVAFFDGAAATGPLAVLLVWAGAGLALLFLGARRPHPAGRHETREPAMAA
ncbi:hypothetical protein DPM19_27185 [Actinomadura craniellae]|uniref:ABC transporter permease n=1 Tax=Actinomadura craniellae TaxID=2231787 RepID=A0A365H1G5_9ACTN|nr:hypothetical protein [Actinomadura craniellae]RAY12033.1 hypothetical protein DPM19_27185 [Actinomadura craniellae]